MEYDHEKVGELGMVLLTLTMFRDHGMVPALKGQSPDVLDALFERGWIHGPKGKATQAR